mmetsp:Transcript_26422/g.48346  ORF Transcript_26422/g.48346 Transcript_26422/m.48346 type:complete len:1009 (+) Transcript_26422:60-3086(+)
MLFRADAWSGANDTSLAWREHAACRFDALLPGRSGQDSIIPGRPGAWKRRPQVLASLPSIKEHTGEVQSGAPFQAGVGQRVQGILHKPGPQSLAFAPKASAPLDEAGVRTAMRPQFVVPTTPPRPAPPRSSQPHSRWGSGRALYVDLVQAINGTSVAKLVAATTVAEAEGATKWTEYGVACERLQSLQQLKVALNSSVESTRIAELSEVLAAARSLKVHQDAPMVDADSWPQYALAEARYKQLVTVKADLEKGCISSSLPALVGAIQAAEELGVGSWPEAETARTRLQCLQRLCGQLYEAVATCQRPTLEAVLQEAAAFRVSREAEAPLGLAVALVASRLKGFQRAETLGQLAAGSDLCTLRQIVAEAELEAASSYLWQDALPAARERLAALSIIELQLMASRLTCTKQHMSVALQLASKEGCSGWMLFTEVRSQLEQLEAGADASQDLKAEDTYVQSVVVMALALRSGGATAPEHGMIIGTQLAEEVSRLCGFPAKAVRTLEVVYDSLRSQEKASYVELVLLGASREELHAVREAVKSAQQKPAPAASASTQLLCHSQHLWDASVAGDCAEMLQQLPAQEHAVAALQDDQEELASVVKEQIASEASRKNSMASSADLAEEADYLMRHLIGYACSAAQSSSSDGIAAESVEYLGSSAARSESRPSVASAVHTESDGQLTPYCRSLVEQLCDHGSSRPSSSIRTVQQTDSCTQGSSVLGPGSRQSLASAVDTDGDSGRLTPMCLGLMEQLFEGSSTPSSSARTVQLTGSYARGSTALGRDSRLSRPRSSMSKSHRGTPRSASVAHPAGSSEASSHAAEDSVVKLMMEAMEQNIVAAESPLPKTEDHATEPCSSAAYAPLLPAPPETRQQTEISENDTGRATPCSEEVADVLRGADARTGERWPGQRFQRDRAMRSTTPIEGVSDARTTPISFLLLEGTSDARTTPLSFLLLQSSSTETGPHAPGPADTSAEEARVLAASRATVYSGEGDEAAAVAAAVIQSSLPDDSSS